MSSKDASLRSSASPGLLQLFAGIEKQFQSTKISDCWDVLTIACIVAGPEPDIADQFYLYLRDQPKYGTSDARKAMIRRLREALVKSVPIVGVCKPLESILAIAKVEREEDKDYTFTRKDWKCDEENHKRGQDWLEKIYTRNTSDTLGLFNAHKDFSWISSEITYGLYLSDRQVLNDVDTEMIVLPAIMMQNLPIETHWHIRGTRRIGVSKEDTQVAWNCVQMIAGHFGVSLSRVPTVDSVESDV